MGFWLHVDRLLDASVSEKHTTSIFKAKVAMLGSGGIYMGLEEGRAEEVDQPTWSQNVEDCQHLHHHRHHHYCENLRSRVVVILLQQVQQQVQCAV